MLLYTRTMLLTLNNDQDSCPFRYGVYGCLDRWPVCNGPKTADALATRVIDRAQPASIVTHPFSRAPSTQSIHLQFKLQNLR